jgi:Tfp pilus assembly protein PilN
VVSCTHRYLTFVDRKPPATTSNRFTTPEPTLDAGEVLERIRTIQSENLRRLDDDIALLTKYLKTQEAPKAVIDVIKGLSSQQQKRWENALEQIEDLLED